MAGTFGATYSLNISQMKKAISEANSLIKENESEWLASASAMGDWTKSEEGLSGRLKTLSKNIEAQENTISKLVQEKERLKKRNDELLASLEEEEKHVKDLGRQYELSAQTLGENAEETKRLKKEYEQASNALLKHVKEQNSVEKAVEYANDSIIKASKTLQSQRKEYDKVSDSVDKFSKETDDAGDESKKASKQLEKLDDTARDLDGGFSIAKGAIAGFIANGLTAMVSAVGSAVSSLVGLTENTREYRTMLGTLSTMADQVGASGDYVIDKWMDVNAVLNDEQAAVEGMNNLMSAGYTAEKELDAITKALEGASLQWKDTLKFEGLADSLQEWIGSGGANLTGNFAELLERLGYNLEDVTAQTKNMTDEQRRNWAIQTLNKEGLDDVSDAYREANKDLIEYNKANSDLLNAQSLVGEAMQPFVTTVKQTTADILYSFVDMANGVEGAGDQLLYNIGYLAGSIYKNVKSAIDMMLPVVQSLIPKIIDFITTNLPSMVAQGIAIITSIVDGISANIPQVISQISTMLGDIILMITDNAPALLNSALNLFGQIVLAIPQVIVDLSAKLPEIITSIMDGLYNGENSVYDTALNLLMQIVDAIPDLLNELWANLPQIIDAITQSLSDAIPKVLEGSKALLWKIVDAIPSIVAGLAQNLPQILSSILGFFRTVAPQVLNGAVDLLMNIIKAIPTIVIEIGKSIPQILTAIIDGLLAGAKDLFNVGVDLIKGIVDGILSFDVWGAIKGVGSSIVNGFKKLFGIHSPSKVMKEEIGEPITMGVAEGIEEGTNAVLEVAEDTAIQTVDTFTEGWNDAINGTKRELVESTAEAVESVGSAVAKTAKSVGAEAGQALVSTVAEEAKKESKDYSSDVSNILTGLFNNDYSSITDSMLNAFGKTSTIGSVIAGFLGFAKDTLSEGAKEEEGEIATTMQEMAQALVDGLMNSIVAIVDNLPSIIKGAIEFIKSFAIALIKAIPELIKQLPKIITSVVNTLISEGIPALFEVGAELVKGLIEGMFSINIFDVVKSVGNGIVNGFKKLFGIRSPSRVMKEEIGKNLALGITEGVTENIGTVNDALKNGVNTSIEMDGLKPRYVTVNQTNHYAQAHSRYEIYKSKKNTANAVKLAMQGV